MMNKTKLIYYTAVKTPTTILAPSCCLGVATQYYQLRQKRIMIRKLHFLGKLHFCVRFDGAYYGLN